MTIHKEGYIILLSAFLALVVIILVVHFLGSGKPLMISVLSCSLVVMLLLLNFFREPLKKPLLNDSQVLSPAYGKVVAIEEVAENEYFNDRRKLVSIFMSPLDVHVNWYPVGGIVRYFKYHRGKYLVAWHPKSSLLNERTTVVIENSNGNILTRQIAGAVARRIVWYCNVGDSVRQGDQLGFIKFGSRLDVFLPLSAKVNVEINQHVKGCETVIAEFR